MGKKVDIVSTGESATYNALRESSYKHGAVQHSLTIYVDVIHHVNDIKGVWNHLKRGIVNTHASVPPQHLQKYVKEFAFRYDH
jgi:transposase-like protein